MEQAEASAGRTLQAGRPSAGIVLHSRGGALSNREVLERTVGLPRTPETVERYARLAGVDFRGSPVEILESADDVAYLDFQGAAARTDALGVQLGPAAFQDEETLVRTLGHESVHVRQHQEGRITSLTGPLEDEAYGDALRIGDRLGVAGADGPGGSVVVRSIELHGAPATTTIAVEGASADAIRVGAVLTRE